MAIFNFSFGNKRTPSQFELGRSGNLANHFYGTGIGYVIDEFNLYSQIKDYRTDLLNGTNWRSTDLINATNFQYIQFLKVLSKYSSAALNDYLKVGLAVFARIDGVIYYVSYRNYTKTIDKIIINGYPNAEIFRFDEPNVYCGENTIYWKCEPYQRLYNIALSCQKNGMSKSGFVSIISPKTPSGSPVFSTLKDDEIEEMEKRLSEKHGVSTNEQSNMLIFKREVDVKTITFDSTKLGILDTKRICEEFMCSKLGVPFVLLPSSGQTFANYEEANKILYENHSKYCESFCKFVKSEIGLDIDYKTIAEEDKGIDQSQNISLNGAQISSLLEILASVSGGLITPSSAIEIIISAIPQISKDQAKLILQGVNIGVSEAVNATPEQQI